MRHTNKMMAVFSLLAVVVPPAACIDDGEALSVETMAGQSDEGGGGAPMARDTLERTGRAWPPPGKGGVRCGPSTCSSSTQACCLDAYAGTATCIDKGVFCGTPTSTGAAATCDQQSDCPRGQSCCWQAAAGYLSIRCMPHAECPADFSFVSNRVLCASPAERRACPPGEMCTPLDGAIPAGWSACTPMR